MMEQAVVASSAGGRCERNTRVCSARDLADGLREPEGVAQGQQVVGAWHQDFPAVVELRRNHAAGLRHHGVLKVAEEHDRGNADLAEPGEGWRVSPFQVSGLEPR